MITSSCVTESHHSNHAVIVSSSRYWFNYRHAMNALSIYDIIRKHGIPDSNIVLMLADEIPTNARNPKKNLMEYSQTSPYSQDIEIDFRGDEVTVENLVKVLLGRHDEGEMRQLHSDEDSNILIYWTGHGGNQFFKFQDVEEITAQEIARIFKEMHLNKRYKEILFIVDTCQAFTLGDELSKVPNVFFVGSSLRGENSYGHQSNLPSDAEIAVSGIERYTHAIVRFLRKNDLKKLSLKQGLVDHLRFEEQRAHVGYTDKSCNRKFYEIPMSDFFANVQASPMEPLEVQEKISWDTLGRAAQGTDGDASTKNAIETCNVKDASKYEGVEPSDSLFIAVLLLFIGTIMIVSQFV